MNGKAFSKGAFSLLLPALFLLSAVVETKAEVVRKYVPPKRKNAQQTQGTGSRGCNNGKTVDLKLLVPENYTPKTTLGRPTFFWYVSEPAPIRFTLVDPDAIEPIFEHNLYASNSGVISLTVPPENIELSVGKKYIWTVAVICNPLRPSSNIYARTWVERIPIPTELKKALSTTTDRKQRGLIYKKFNVWYDALSEFYAIKKVASKTETDKSFLRLLGNVGLLNIDNKG